MHGFQVVGKRTRATKENAEFLREFKNKQGLTKHQYNVDGRFVEIFLTCIKFQSITYIVVVLALWRKLFEDKVEIL